MPRVHSGITGSTSPGCNEEWVALPDHLRNNFDVRTTCTSEPPSWKLPSDWGKGRILIRARTRERWHWGGRPAGRRATSSSRLLSGPRAAVSFFSALILLFGVLVPSWHQARVGELAQLQVLLGEQAEALSVSICHHEDGGTSDLPGDDGSPLCKKPCPLCLALQHHSPAVAPRGIAWPAYTGIAVAAFVPHRTELRAARSTAEQGRPRAPPLG